MKIKKTPFVPALAAVSILRARGDGQPAQSEDPISENHITAFRSMVPESISTRKMIKGDEVYQTGKLKQTATMFAKSSKKPFEHPQSDLQGNGEALPAVQQNPEKFKTTKGEFHAAAEKLSEKAQDGNLEEIKATYGEVAAGCRACHDSSHMEGRQRPIKPRRI